VSLRPSAVRRALSRSGIAFAVVAGLLPAAAGPVAAATPTELFFSEYIEGSSNNKALEIYNGTGAAIDLAANGYSIQMFFNGSASAGLTINLTGSVANGDVYVVAQSSAVPAILDQADQSNGSGWFNGDDAVVLRKGTAVIDSLGQIGFDPGTEWGTGAASTADNTLRRKAAISAGETTTSDAFDPSTQWDGFATDTFGGLGAHTVSEDDLAPTVTATTPASNATGVQRSANITVTFSEDVAVAADAITLTCTVSGDHAGSITGGPQIYTFDPTGDFAFSDSCSVTVHAAGVTDTDADDPPDTMAADRTWSFTTVEAPACEAPFRPIPQIQGATGASSFAGTSQTTEGRVVGDFQGGPGLNGFFLQDAAGDGNTATSDGIFVFVPAASPLAGINVEVGDEVRLTGRVVEFNTLTEIDNVTSLIVCDDTTTAPAPTVVTFPETVNGDLEKVEGMLITIPEPMTAAQNFFQGRFGQVTLASEGRAYTPTNIYDAGSPEAIALADENQRRLLVLDDGWGGQNPNPIPYFAADGTLRAGDTTTGLTGVVDWGSINSNTAIRDYRLHPTAPVTFSRQNPRTAAPDAVGGSLKVSSFNVLNFFNGNGTGGGFPTSRGATNQAELDRQTAKIAAAITAIDADVLGLMEIENDGSGPESAVQELVDALNAATAPGTYAVVPDPVTGTGTDEIKVALIYQPARATTVGASASSADPIFERRPVAQTFLTDDGAGVTVVVNHFKSKSSCPASAADPDADQGDGQGCWNARRVVQAHALLAFIDTLTAGPLDDDVLIVGDLNAYAKEDPIQVIEEAGYVNQIEESLGDEAYSFVFDGQSGYLDHGLASPSLSPQVTGATEWHINADEPSVIDYNTEFKPDDRYAPTPYRSSDHDPVVVGIDASGCLFTVSGTTMTLVADCTTDETIDVPDDWTLDGAGHTITAVDPDGGHYVGAVVRATGGTTTTVRDLGVTASGLADVCDAGADRLWGILFEGAGGSIVDNTVNGVNQGASGCQEGVGIEARNAPFTSAGPDVAVAISGNEVTDYQKGGIVANGSVVATIEGNSVTGSGPISYIAQNGIQVAFGGSAAVRSNVIAANFYTPKDNVACGVLMFDADGVKQGANVFAGNERDVCNVGRGGGSAAKP
jgi:predicted extracellular nuclease